MDWQRVKEKVTEEVIRQLKTDGAGVTRDQVQALVVEATAGAAGAAGGAVGGGAGFAAGAAPISGVPSAAPRLLGTIGSDFRTDYLVVVAGPVSDEVAELIRTLEGKGELTVAADGDETMAKQLAQGAGLILVPDISAAVAAKTAGLIGDSFAAAILVHAALLGKRAVIAREGMAVPPGSSWAARRKAEEVAGSLRTLGFIVTDLKGIASALKQAGAGIAPHPAVLASRVARAKIVLPKAVVCSKAGEVAEAADFDRELAQMIDHTLLKPESTKAQVTKLCQEAARFGFCSVCINPTWVPLAAQCLKGSSVKVCTVIGFPLGATSSAAKAAEAADAIAGGATEVDMVLNVGALKSGQHDLVLTDMKAVVAAARGTALVKVILEIGLLTDEEKVKACQLAVVAGVDFVKSSTGFGPGGATTHDIALMRKTVGPDIGVKASGGIRDYQTAMAMVRAGANRIGASASVNIVRRIQASDKEKY